MRRELGLPDHIPIQYDDNGWDSRVYLVNRGEAVFKFPRSPEAKTQYRREIAVLQMLAALNSPVRVPRIQWCQPDLEWFGYQGVVGEQLSYRLPDLDSSTKIAIGHALGRFLRQFHACHVDAPPTVPIDAEIANYQAKYRLASAALERLSPSERAMAQWFFFDILPREMRRSGGELRLTHGDLGPWNVILTDDLQVGVIDLGDACYQDPSRDFAGYSDEIIFHAALEAYGADDWLREKAWLRIKAFPILDIPFYLGKNDEPGIQWCLDLVRRLIVRGERTAQRPLHPAVYRPEQ